MTIDADHLARRDILIGLATSFAATATSGCGWIRSPDAVTDRSGGVTVKEVRFAGGAKGDGATDDTAAIQAALDSATVVFLPAGTYIISRSLILRNGQRITGVGQSTILKKQHERVDRLIINAPGATTGIVVERLTLDGNRTSTIYTQGKDGMILSNCNGAVVQNVVARNCLNDGIVIEYGEGNRVIECTTHGNAKDGIYCSGSRNITIARNQSHNNAVAGIAIAATAGSLVTKNSLRGNRFDIMLARDARDIRVLHNDCRSVNAFVVSGENLAGQTLNGRNYPTKPAPGWDWLYGATRCTLDANYFGGSVRLIMFNDGIVSGNTCAGSRTQGLLLQGASRNRVTANTIRDWGPDFSAIQLASLTTVDAVPASQGLPLRSVENVVSGNKIMRGAGQLGIVDNGLRSRIYGNPLIATP